MRIPKDIVSEILMFHDQKIHYEKYVKVINTLNNNLFIGSAETKKIIFINVFLSFLQDVGIMLYYVLCDSAMNLISSNRLTNRDILFIEDSIKSFDLHIGILKGILNNFVISKLNKNRIKTEIYKMYDVKSKLNTILKNLK